MAAGLCLHLCPRLRAFAASSRPLFAAHSGALPLRRAGPAMPLAARARRGLSSSTAAAPPAEDDDFATAADLRFEPPLEVVKYPDPILRARNKRINTFDANLRALADEMFDVMYKTDGIGLSAPQVGVNVQLMRPESVKIEAQDVTGAKIKVKLSGLPARVFQHEFDHLLGILFFDRMTMDILETVREQLKNLEKKYEERTGLLSPETVENYKG
nr:unnamed protein product [Digitaria exilis]